MVYLFLADGVAEMEAVTIADCLRRLEIDLKLVGVTGMTVTGARGVKILADIPVSDVPDGTHEMLIFPGGLRGVENLAASERVRELAARAFEEGAPVGAICAAPSFLAGLGLLKERTVTCYPSTAEAVRRGGAYVLPDRAAVREGALVTGQGPAASIPFSLALAELLLDRENADFLASQLLYA
ncbi:MAG: DJ-1/PfpI family protein [Oscillospiraceae bacterium]|jgi:4-methyl-5(b-hydroxyethyl)-thiazole monophosphate biosynthesis|nr:DJ-1/PfpI family protein [Oscillospiraceae bacterium]